MIGYARSYRRRRTVELLACVGLVVALVWTSRALAETPSESPVPTAPPRAGGEQASDATPRGAVTRFLDAARIGDYAAAATHLDLRYLPSARRQAAGVSLARQLSVVLDRALWIDLDELSDQETGDREDGMPNRDLIGKIPNGTQGPVDVLLARVHDPTDAGVWKFAAETLVRVPALYDEYGSGPLTEVLPAPLVEIRFLDVRLWQWIALALLVLAAVALSWLAARLIIVVTRAFLRRAHVEHDAALVELVLGPLRLAVLTMVFAAGLPLLALAVPARRFLGNVESALGIFAATWLLLRALDGASHATRRRLVERGRASATSVVPLARRTVKGFVILLAAIAALQNFGFNVTGIIAGLGVGGLAVALAAQKTVENLFGGVALVVDQPVRVGDFCRFGDRVGTIEDVGLRSTRIRTLDRTVVSIPNAEFSALQLENFSRRDRMWLHPTIGLRYETTPDQLRHVLVELKRLLLAHPMVDAVPARVRFVGFGAYSLDLEVFAYVRTADYDEFLAVQEDLFLRMIDVVAASGTGFAFPSQTVYTRVDDGVDVERRRAAEAQVARWRAEHRLFLPYMPEEVAAAVEELDYPPDGSPSRG